MRLGTRKSSLNREAAENIAIGALGFLASDHERLDRFLGLTGLGPENLRAAAGEPGFFGQVLDHIMADESLLMTFAANQGEAPETIAAAHAMLAGRSAETDF